MATQDSTLVVTDELHAHTRLSAFRDPITGQYPPLAGADDAAAEAAEGAAAAESEAAEGAGEELGGEEKPKPGDWKNQARRHEREAKAARERAEAAEARVKELEEAGQTEHEKALAQAREEAAAETRQEVTGQVREKLLKAEIRALAAGTFADPDDAHRLLDLEDDDIFNDDGDIQTDALQSALDELLERKPHLRAAPPNGGKPAGDADAGKGKGAKDLESQTVEDHLKRIQKTAAT